MCVCGGGGGERWTRSRESLFVLSCLIVMPPGSVGSFYELHSLHVRS